MSGDQTSTSFRLVSPSHAKLIREAALRYAEGSTDRTDFFRLRGIPDELVRKYKLGVVVDPLPEHSRFEGRISIPYMNARGIHYMSFRCPCTTKECVNCANGRFKYMAVDGEYRPLFNSWILDQDLDKLYVSEGELNSSLASFDGFPCVGTGSATRFEQHWGFLLDGLDEIIILKDGDGEGKASKAMVRLWRKNLPKETRVGLKTINFPDDYDYASYRLAFGQEGVRRFVLGDDYAEQG